MRRVLPVALLAATMLSSPAWAGWTQTVTDVSMANMPQAYIAPPGEQAYVGPFILNGRSWDLAWCLDLYGNISLGGQNFTYQVDNFSDTGYATIKNMGNTQQGIDKQHLIAGLMQKGDNLLWPGGISNPSDVGEAIQLAIWSAEYGDAFSYTGVSPAVVALMNRYITEAPTSNHGLVAYDGESHQTLGKIPEPMTITILGVGMLGLGLARKRR
jgi:hypothetical protein